MKLGKLDVVAVSKYEAYDRRDETSVPSMLKKSCSMDGDMIGEHR
jgi:hypothetical protein